MHLEVWLRSASNRGCVHTCTHSTEDSILLQTERSFLGLRDKSIIKSLLHRITVTNIMATTARKNISEWKETALPLRVLSFPEYSLQCFAASPEFFLHQARIDFWEVWLSVCEKTPRSRGLTLSRMHRSFKRMILIILYHHLQLLDLQQGYQRITVLF